VTRIVSATICVSSSIVTESFAHMFNTGLLSFGVASTPPAPTSPP
jgi:hypothetical protein